MRAWRPQFYRKTGQLRGIDPAILDRAVAIGDRITAIHPDIAPIFTLNHLANAAGVDYRTLRAVISRAVDDPYRIFRIRKRPINSDDRRFRVICVPEPELMTVQRWIANRILAFARPHASSVAYAKGSDIRHAAFLHCGCLWLIKLDILNFFESVSEIDVFRAFRSLNFEPLVSFEMTRLCTRLGQQTRARSRRRWIAHTEDKFADFPVYQHDRIGHLPQGAPTSPMLANLAVRRFDEEVAALAAQHGLLYTRYADDICLSTASESFSRADAAKTIGAVFETMGRHGFSPNVSKTTVVPPGGRKVVLGLLVDGSQPRLTKDFRKNLRRHLHYLVHPDYGPVRHATSRGFAAVAGLKHHIEGLVRFARHIDPKFAADCSAKLQTVIWPM